MKHSRPDYNRIQDPLGRIPRDEPVFLLRGQDQLAADVVRYYASTALVFGLEQVYRDALEQSRRMAEWPVKKLPDIPDVHIMLLEEIPQVVLMKTQAEALMCFLERIRDFLEMEPNDLTMTALEYAAKEKETIGELKGLVRQHIENLRLHVVQAEERERKQVGDVI